MNMNFTQEEIIRTNTAIKNLKALIEEGCTDFELYKMVITEDLQYLK